MEIKDKFTSDWAKATRQVSSIVWNKMQNQADLYLGHFIVWTGSQHRPVCNRFMSSPNQKQPLKKKKKLFGCTSKQWWKRWLKVSILDKKKKQTNPNQQKTSTQTTKNVLKPFCYSNSFHTGNEARKTCCSDFSYGKMTETSDWADSWLKSHH